MSDEIDRGQEREQLDREISLQLARRAAADIKIGTAGDCDLCGEHSMRLIEGACAPCRDKYHLP